MKRATALLIACLLAFGAGAPAAQGYVLGRTIDRTTGGCPQLNRFFDPAIGLVPINRRWSTSLPANGAIVTTAAQGTAAQQAEVQKVISDSFDVWAGVTGTTIKTALGPLIPTMPQDACTGTRGSPSPDGLNTICLNQTDNAFTTGVLAFAVVVTSDTPGETVGSITSTFAGQILDADILFRNDGTFSFATPSALASCSSCHDLETVLIHELGHCFGLDHSAVWPAMLFPFAPPRGTFLGVRPTAQVPDGPLSDDDRAGIRVLYPDPADTTNVGVISGRVLPANPLSVSIFPGVTGIFGAHVVAVDADTGQVVAATVQGWSCTGTGPTQFDGFYEIDKLPVPRNYKVYAEPLIGGVSPRNFGSTNDMCRAGTNNACTPPPVNTNFTTQVRRTP